MSSPSDLPPPGSAAPLARFGRSFWINQFRQWHWISSALCLIVLLGFTVTGITLNHAADIPATPTVTRKEATLPAPALEALKALPSEGDAPLPADLARGVHEAIGVDVAGRATEISPEEIYIGLPRPGGDGWLTIDREDGHLSYEMTDRGLIAILNDLHKGRNSGPVWAIFIDVFAVACLIFCLSGLALLWMHGRHRAITWPVVAAGLAIPLILFLIYVH
ncbi:MAG: PepSY-associated TM helix domain-containing protein [Asticcacaulis sp.]